MDDAMKLLRNEKGIALITSLMLTLLSMTVVMALLYMLTMDISQTGMRKRYKTALEASTGGAQMMLREILPQILQNYDSTTLASDLERTFSDFSLTVTSATCLRQKFTNSTANWGSACSQTLNPGDTPDMSMTLQATNGTPYTVYTKVIDTIKGNTDLSGLQLDGDGVTSSQSTITPQSIPYIYRLEVRGQRSTNPTEQARISVLYSY